MSANRFVIVSDGSSGRGAAAAACIIEGADGFRKKLAALLPPSTPSSAELSGGILGLAALHALQEGRWSAEWFCDNDGVVQQVRDRKISDGELAAAYRLLTAEPTVEAFSAAGARARSSVRLCHRACSWVRRKGSALLTEVGEGPIGRLAAVRPLEAWWLVDLRSDNGGAYAASALVARLRENGGFNPESRSERSA